MTSISHPAMFAVRIQSNSLVVTQHNDGDSHTVCSLELDNWPSFLLEEANVVCRYQFAREFKIFTPNTDEAARLITQMVEAQLQYKSHISAQVEADAKSRSKKNRFNTVIFGGVLVIALVAWKVDFGSTIATIKTTPVLTNDVAPPPASPPPAQLSAAPVPNTPVVPPKDADGWSLPQNVRESLPEKLRSATDRQLFTVDYSSGHARTVYVFSDPNCPNCQRMESSLKAASNSVNVVAFPVAIIGKEESIEAITPVLCLPPEKRLAAWDALFKPTLNALHFGKEKPAADNAMTETLSGNCDVAQKALSVNEVAYATYRIPGTPWAISDDGRYVPQSVLRDPAQLQLFLDNKELAHAPE